MNGFAPVFDQWPGFQIGNVDWLIGGVDRWPGLGFLSVARFLNGFVFVCVAWLCCWVVFVFVCVGVVMGSVYNGCVLCVEPVLGGRNKNGC